jgi:predicted RNase H-like HicB family nuclease
MRNFIALIHKEPNSDFGVSFPDFPGIATAGLDLDDAHRMAEDALSLHLAGMEDDHTPIPEPSSLESIMLTRKTGTPSPSSFKPRSRCRGLSEQTLLCPKTTWSESTASPPNTDSPDPDSCFTPRDGFFSLSNSNENRIFRPRASGRPGVAGARPGSRRACSHRTSA